MRAIALLNQKGGSGKTTTAVNLAAALAESGRRVLLLDFDPSAAASGWLKASQDGGPGLLEALTEDRGLIDLVRETGVPGLDIIPSSPVLQGAEKRLAGEIGAETLLKRRTAKLPPGRWDYLLIDCPPTVGLLGLNALAAAREVLVPVEAHVITLGGLVSLMETLEVVRERLNADLKLCGILACRVDKRTNHAQEVVASLRKKFGPLALKTVIRENVRLAECPSFGEPITRYASSSPGAEDYRALAKEIQRQEKGGPHAQA